MPKANQFVIALMSIAPFVLAALPTSAFAQSDQEQIVAKALDVIDAGFKCTLPITSTERKSNVTSVSAARDRDFLNMTVKSYWHSKSNPRVTPEGVNDESRYWARLKDLSFSKITKNGHSYLNAKCRSEAKCITHEHSSQSGEDTLSLLTYLEKSEIASTEVLTCDDKAAQALVIGYTHLARLALNRTTPDISEWENAKSSDDHLVLRRFIAKFQSSPLASQAYDRLVAIERVAGPASSYRELILPHSQTYAAPKRTPYYPGPHEFFNPSGFFAADEKFASKGRTGNGPDDWIVVSRDGEDRFVPRKIILSEIAYETLISLRVGLNDYEDMLRRMRMSRGAFSKHAGIYSTSCRGFLSEFNMFIFFSDGVHGTWASLSTPSMQSRFILSPLRNVWLSGRNTTDRVMLYSLKYTNDLKNFKQIAFLNNSISIENGKENFLRFQRCDDDAQDRVRQRILGDIENFQEKLPPFRFN